MFRRLVFVLAILAPVSLLVAPPSSAAWAGDNGRIAYNHGFSSSGARLWWSNPDGSDAKPVPFIDPGQEVKLAGVFGPNWGPDGRHLVATLRLDCTYGPLCSDEVAYIDSLTGEVRQLTCDGTEPSPSHPSECLGSQTGPTLSPNGSTAAFITAVLFDRLTGAIILPPGNITTAPVTRTCARGGGACTGGDLTHLTNEAGGATYEQLSWSPDGDWLLAKRTEPTTAAEDVVAVRTDGSGTLVNLTSDLPRTVTYTNPRWSPDGSSVMVTGGGSRGYTFGVTCTPTTCTRTSNPALFFSGSSYSADFSPDGTRAVVNRPSGAGASGAEVWTVSLAGLDQDLQQVTSSAALGGVETFQPSWQSVPLPTPVFTSDAPPTTGQVGTAFSFTFTASGGATFSALASSLPSGLSLSSDGALTGTPAAAGDFTFTVIATNASGSTAAGPYTIAIAPEPALPLAVSTQSLPGGIVGQPYSAALTAAGGTLPYIWSITVGTLPAGLAISSDGVISGIPTGPGTSSMSFAVTDSGNPTAQAASASLSIQIVRPVISISPQTLPDGRTKTAYGVALSASGGSPAYGFSVSSGKLPTGLTLRSDGMLSGRPKKAGNFQFSVSATDAFGTIGVRGYQLLIVR